MNEEIKVTAKPARTPRDWGFVYLKGMLMGAADSVPGVSGGTVAFMTGIYEELIYSLQSINLHAIQTLFTRGIPACWRQVNATFLLVLMTGIVTSIVLLANLMVFLLENYNRQVLAFFAGLILASSVYLLRQTEKWQSVSVFALAAGLVLAVGVGMLPALQGTPSLPVYFFGGMLAITAMILPGISGAFILVLLGLYLPVLDALKSLNVPVVLVFVTGCATGLIAFSQLLGWLFRHHRDNTLFFLIGVLIGSLYNLWPWQITDSVTQMHDAGAALKPVMPATWESVNGLDAGIAVCLLLAVTGFVLVMALEYLSQTRAVSE